MTSEEAIHDLFIKQGLTLSIAESCTGGQLAATLTRVPGASQFFLGGIVAYSNDLKVELLKVTQESLKKYGAVSREVVIEMAQGAIALTHSDFCIAVSGIAGPEGGTKEKPVGTIWGAIGQKGKLPFAWQFNVQGDRLAIIIQSTNIVLNKLLEVSRRETEDSS